jgi:16S rRNA (cytosine1402-N4)-methyltransferase
LAASHTPVLAEEAVRWLRVEPGGTYFDATVGLGGHAEEIAKRLTTGRLIGLDRDERALEIARNRLKVYGERVMLVQADFSRIDEVAREMELPLVDGILADLGVSSLQLDTAERGFSFRLAGPLDMRMGSEMAVTAAEIVNETAEGELANLLYRFGEERDSRRIARAIVRARPIRSTEHLATVVAGAHISSRGTLGGAELSLARRPHGQTTIPAVVDGRRDGSADAQSDSPIRRRDCGESTRAKRKDARR